MRSRFLSLCFLIFCLCGFTNREYTVFYDVYVQDVVNTLTGTTPSGLSATQKFNNQYFTIWLSPVASEQADLPTYYAQIKAFCTAHNIRKVIWYLGYTTASASFYNPASTDPTSLVQLLQNNPLPSYTQIEFFFDCYSMANGIVYTPSTTAPTPPTHSILPAYMTQGVPPTPPSTVPWHGNLYNCLWWARDMFANVPDVTLISGVTVDPENNCSSGGVAPYTRAVNADQAIVNYLDEFSSLNVAFQPLERGMTFDGGSKVQIFGNRAAIPITDTNLINDTDTIFDVAQNMYFFNGTDATHTTPWTRPDPAAPFLDNIYPQLYNLSAPFIYTLPNQPTQAGLKFLQLLSLTPYCPGLTSTGALSTITFTSGSTTINGTNTLFSTEIDDSGNQPNANTPLAYLDAQGTQHCLATGGDVHNPCPAKVHSVTNDTTLTLNTTPTTSQTNVDWLYVENEINYTEYVVTPGMVSGIFLMFSAEASFFGQWTLDQFMNFVISFYNQGQTYPLYYGTGVIPLPNQFAVFTYEQMTGKATSPPPNIWFPGE
ncbi:MAG: hypothetical protein KBC64_07275 [Simkaniaceae bacterium]|nr:hypothetical protein [Simkaniaceae bacterium]